MSVLKYGKDLSAFVKKLRRDEEWTQQELGRMLGLSGQYVSNVERGAQKGTVSFCAHLLHVCPADRKKYLMDLIGEAAMTTTVKRLKNKAIVLRKKGR